MPEPFPVDPPEPGTVEKTARRIRGEDRALDRRLLRILMEGGRERSELQDRLEDWPGDELEASLKRLMEEGLVRRRAVRSETVTRQRYELSGLGDQVLHLL